MDSHYLNAKVIKISEDTKSTFFIILHCERGIYVRVRWNNTEKWTAMIITTMTVHFIEVSFFAFTLPI